MAKSIPAIGALKLAPMAAPAPAATMPRIWSSPRRALREMNEPTAAPICTTGPSRPAEPPPPSVNAVARILNGTERLERYPP